MLTTTGLIKYFESESMAEPEEIDCEYTQEVVCPYCGYVDKDSWEIDFGDDMEGSCEVECGRCEKELVVEREVSVTYSSYKKEEAE